MCACFPFFLPNNLAESESILHSLMSGFFLLEVGLFDEEIFNHGDAFVEAFFLLLNQSRLGGDLPVELFILSRLFFDALLFRVGLGS